MLSGWLFTRVSAVLVITVEAKHQSRHTLNIVITTNNNVIVIINN